jgi:3,4-dihydroxy 2-butanone 4-phosphate synthase/GTP cyclohydrolase II
VTNGTTTNEIADLARVAYSEGKGFVSPIAEVLDDLRNGRMVILVDAEDRENEGDLVIPAQMATPEAINFMARFGRGLICLSMTEQRAQQLRLELMTRHNGARNRTAFTVSIEAKEGIATGISAHDRALTIATAIDPGKSHDDIVSPGHVFPLVAREGGVLVRAGHTEASVDLARMAGLLPAGVICEI